MCADQTQPKDIKYVATNSYSQQVVCWKLGAYDQKKNCASWDKLDTVLFYMLK